MDELTYLDAQLDKDIGIIRDLLNKMAKLVLRQLEDAVTALTEGNRSLAYTVVLKDRVVDNMEDRIDRLCQEFLVRHMPVSEQLRFIVAVAKVNSEIERIGDYAEAIARRAVQLSDATFIPEKARILEMSNLSIDMLSQAVESFLSGDADRALVTLEADNRVDKMNSEVFQSLSTPENIAQDIAIRFSLLGLVNRIERVADRACNIAEETVYVSRGQVLRHLQRSEMRVLFFSHNNACRSQMAEGIARKISPVNFFFKSAGKMTAQMSPKAVEIMSRRGIDISRQQPKLLEHVGELDDFNIVVTLSHEAEEALPEIPYNVVHLNWDIADPGKATGTEEEIDKVYNDVIDNLTSKIKELTQGLLGAADYQEDD